MTFRAPSMDLLRALRTAVRLPSTPGTHMQIHAQQLRLHRAPQVSTRSLCVAASPPRPPPRRQQLHQMRRLSITATSRAKATAPKTHDRGPRSTEDTQTDFGRMDIFNTAGTATPATSIDACTSDGFHLNNGVKIGGDASARAGVGMLLLGGEAFEWRPWVAVENTSTSTSTSTGTGNAAGGAEAGPSTLLSRAGVLEITPQSLGVLELLHPKPDLLIVGTGARLWGLGKQTREFLTSIGVRVDVMDTGNASAAYNLLATERGVDGVGCAMVPVGWRGPGKGR